MAEGKWIELTIHDDNNLWSAPITIHSDNVKSIYPITMKCYETEAHQGCRIQLLENVPHVLPKEINSETECSSIDVWESYDLVLKKLKSASRQSK